MDARLLAGDVPRSPACGPGDRLFFPFSFGPFLGFWTAFEAAARLGCLCLPGGGMSSTARLRFLLDNAATVVFCTPTYALHLAEVAAGEGIDLAGVAGAGARRRRRAGRQHPGDAGSGSRRPGVPGCSTTTA